VEEPRPRCRLGRGGHPELAVPARLPASLQTAFETPIQPARSTGGHLNGTIAALFSEHHLAAAALPSRFGTAGYAGTADIPPTSPHPPNRQTPSNNSPPVHRPRPDHPADRAATTLITSMPSADSREFSAGTETGRALDRPRGS
jgi:hypothetical protein